MPVPNMKAKPPRPNEEPYAGKLLVRFREGLGRRLPSLLDKVSCCSLLVCILLLAGCSFKENPVANPMDNPYTGEPFVFLQGNLTVTGLQTDLAIEGPGFFVVRKGSDQLYYRRPGRFYMDGEGSRVLASDSSAHLQAVALVKIAREIDGGDTVAVSDSVDSTALVDLRIPVTNRVLDFVCKPKATSEIVFAGNLDSNAGGLGTIMHSSRFLSTAQSTARLVSLFDGNGNSLGINTGDELRISAKGTDVITLLISPSTTLVDLCAAIDSVVRSIGDGNSAKLAANGTIIVYSAGAAIDNLLVGTTRPGSSSYVANAFSWGPRVQSSTAGSMRLLAPASETDALADVFDCAGYSLGLEPGDRIQIAGDKGDSAIVPVSAAFSAAPQNSAVCTIADLLTLIRRALDLPGSAQTADGESSVSINAVNTDDGRVPAGSIAIRGRIGTQYSLTNVAICARNADFDSDAPTRFNANMIMTMVQTPRDPENASIGTLVYDRKGTAHSLLVVFTHANSPDSWRWNITMDAGETIVGGSSGTVAFCSDGSPNKLAFDDSSMAFIFIAASDTHATAIRLDPGNPGSFSGLTQFRAASSISVRSQNGYPAGRLQEMVIDNSNVLSGLFTNKISIPLYRIPLATFLNPGQLGYDGTFFKETERSGRAVIGFGDSLSFVRNRVLEMDVTE